MLVYLSSGISFGLDSVPPIPSCSPHAVRAGPTRRRSSTASSGLAILATRIANLLAHGRKPCPHGIVATFRSFRTLPATGRRPQAISLLPRPRLPPRTSVCPSSRGRHHATLRELPPLCPLRGGECMGRSHLARPEVVHAAPADPLSRDLRLRPPHLRSRAPQPHHPHAFPLKWPHPTT